jgi:hypothetical protein
VDSHRELRDSTSSLDVCQASILQARDVQDPLDDLQTVAEIVQGLRQLGLQPVLVGGMALVILGSQRVTHDYDFVVTHLGDLLAQTIELFYDRGLELVARLNDEGQVISTLRRAPTSMTSRRDFESTSCSIFRLRPQPSQNTLTTSRFEDRPLPLPQTETSSDSSKWPEPIARSRETPMTSPFSRPA